MQLSSAPNFRHLGGYAGHNGRPVAARRIFRSDHLGGLTPEDEVRLRAVGLRRVVDFRGVTERAAAPCALSSLTVHSLPIEPTIVQVITERVTSGHRLSPGEVVEHMRNTYRGFVRNNTHRFAELFAHLLASGEPIVFHCTAGKDRTGLAAALVLHSLGVSEADVLRDYLLTNDRLQPLEGSRHGLDPAVASVLSRVQPEFLQAACELIATDHGDVETYLREGLGVGERERGRLRELYLEPGPG